MSGTLLTRLFGVFLVVWAAKELPRTVYVAAQGAKGSWLGLLVLGVVPIAIPLLLGVLIAWWPRVLYRERRDERIAVDSSLGVLVVGLMGLFLALSGFLDLVFQIGMILLADNEPGRVFADSEAASNTITSFVEFHLGVIIVLYAKRIARRIGGDGLTESRQK